MSWIMNWWWATVLGPVILGIAMAYAMFNRRTLTRQEKRDQAKATEQLYKPEDRLP